MQRLLLIGKPFPHLERSEKRQFLKKMKLGEKYHTSNQFELNRLMAIGYSLGMRFCSRKRFIKEYWTLERVK